MAQRLNHRQKAFCEAYVACGSARAATKAAGYTKNTQDNTKMLFTPSVMEYIDYLNAAVVQEKIANIEECLIVITDIIRDPSQTTENRLKAVDMRLRTLGAYQKAEQEANNAPIVITLLDENCESTDK